LSCMKNRGSLYIKCPFDQEWRNIYHWKNSETVEYVGRFFNLPFLFQSLVYLWVQSNPQSKRNELWINSNLQLLGNQIISGCHDQFTLSGSRNFLDWQKQYKI
jgi:hypothetical protein